MPSMVQIAVGAAMTSLSEQAAAWACFCVGPAVADVIVGSSSSLPETIRLQGRGGLSLICQKTVSALSTVVVVRQWAAMDAGFAESVRELMTALASGGEPSLAAGGGMTRVFRETGAVTPRAAVEVLVDRWFRAAPAHTVLDPDERLLNRPDVGESEKLHATLHEHVIAQRRWQELSNNESTFYRYRRAAIGAFGERLWSEIVDRPLPTNRPLPEYVRFIGREGEVATLLRWLGEPGGTTVGVEGPGGSGKTALLHAVADACEAAGRCWRPVPLPDVR